MLEITHHSGQKRYINPDQIESIYPDAQGHPTIRMSSGIEYVAQDDYDSLVAAVHEWLGKDYEPVRPVGLLDMQETEPEVEPKEDKE